MQMREGKNVKYEIKRNRMVISYTAMYYRTYHEYTNGIIEQSARVIVLMTTEVGRL